MPPDQVTVRLAVVAERTQAVEMHQCLPELGAGRIAGGAVERADEAVVVGVHLVQAAAPLMNNTLSPRQIASWAGRKGPIRAGSHRRHSHPGRQRPCSARLTLQCGGLPNQPGLRS